MAASTRSRTRQRTAAAAHDDVPALVRVLAGNLVTGAAILACLDTVDATRLRRLHPAVAGAVAAVPWADTTTRVLDAVRWRAALPAAVGARLSGRAVRGVLSSDAAVAALAGVACLDLHERGSVTDELLPRLPTSLRTLNVCGCDCLTERASFAHLTLLTSLDCSATDVATAQTGIAHLPPSLLALNVSTGGRISSSLSIPLLPDGVSLAHLSQLRVLHAEGSALNADTLASLPPSIVELGIDRCFPLSASASFGHLRALQTLNAAWSGLGDAALATLPPSLVHLDARWCINIRPAAVLPPLPSLRVLDVSHTHVGDALMASLPAGLEELRIVEAGDVTTDATLEHVRALRALYSTGTALAPSVVAACRARGCAALTIGVLRGSRQSPYVTALAVLAGGRLASGDGGGVVRAWDEAAGSNTTAVLEASGRVTAMAALLDGRRLAVGVWKCVEVWGVTVTPPVRAATIYCDSPVSALAALADGRLAVGCVDGSVQIVDAVLEGDRHKVVVLAGRHADQRVGRRHTGSAVV